MGQKCACQLVSCIPMQEKAAGGASLLIGQQKTSYPSVLCKLLLQEQNTVSMFASLQLPSKLKFGDPGTNQCFVVACRLSDSAF